MGVESFRFLVERICCPRHLGRRSYRIAVQRADRSLVERVVAAGCSVGVADFVRRLSFGLACRRCGSVGCRRLLADCCFGCCCPGAGCPAAVPVAGRLADSAERIDCPVAGCSVARLVFFADRYARVVAPAVERVGAARFERCCFVVAAAGRLRAGLVAGQLVPRLGLCRSLGRRGLFG